MWKMKSALLAALAALFLSLSVAVQAASDAEFPQGWSDWPVVRSGAISGSDSPIPTNAPAIVQETIKTYNWVGEGKGSAYNVRINPAQKQAVAAGKGYRDGPTAVLELTDIGVLLVTEHLLGEPLYGAYSVDGKDLSGAHPSLAPSTCNTCHTGYGEACINGVCSK